MNRRDFIKLTTLATAGILTKACNKSSSTPTEPSNTTNQQVTISRRWIDPIQDGIIHTDQDTVNGGLPYNLSTNQIPVNQGDYAGGIIAVRKRKDNGTLGDLVAANDDGPVSFHLPSDTNNLDIFVFKKGFPYHFIKGSQLFRNQQNHILKRHDWDGVNASDPRFEEYYADAIGQINSAINTNLPGLNLRLGSLNRNQKTNDPNVIYGYAKFPIGVLGTNDPDVYPGEVKVRADRGKGETVRTCLSELSELFSYIDDWGGKSTQDTICDNSSDRLNDIGTALLRKAYILGRNYNMSI
jgi:hypothetical protein